MSEEVDEAKSKGFGLVRCWFFSRFGWGWLFLLFVFFGGFFLLLLCFLCWLRRDSSGLIISFFLLLYNFGLALFFLLLLLRLLSSLDLFGKPLPPPHANCDTDDLPKLLKLFRQPLLIPLQRNILQKAIGEGLRIWPVVPSHENAHLDLLPINEHTIQLFDGARGRFVGLVVHITISLGKARLLVGHNLARQNVAEKTERVIELLVVNPLVQILDEDVAYSRTTNRGVALTPHNTAWLPLDVREVHGIESALRIADLMVVDVSVPQRASGHSIATDANGCHRSDGVEDFEEKTFVDFGKKISNVKAGRVEGVHIGSSSSSCGG
mmetsp:Transcript_11552/g.20788  ORF Transcript_11552/g.20788 Transcript_11552/m.20788 type:complete len:323 (+) Transcript_11552:1516-2484(+)